jgi:predicted GNAT superfamily acetyltransferase
LARRLYDHFAVFAEMQGCTELKSITTPGNKGSIAFHRAQGMTLTGKPNRDGIPVIENYAGLGQYRVVFRKKLSQPGSI